MTNVAEIEEAEAEADVAGDVGPNVPPKAKELSGEKVAKLAQKKQAKTARKAKPAIKKTTEIGADPAGPARRRSRGNR